MHRHCDCLVPTYGFLQHLFHHTSLDDGYNCSYTQEVKTAISIPDDLFESAERLASHLGISRSELYQRAIAALLLATDEDRVTAKLNELYEEPTTSRLDPALEDMQQRSLPAEEW